MPALEHIVDGLHEVVPARQPRRLLAHVGLEIVDKGPAFGAPDLEPLLGGPAVDRALDRKQRVDAAHHLDGDRRQRDLLLSDSLAARVLLDVGHGEEWTARMHPTRRLPNWAGLAA